MASSSSYHIPWDIISEILLRLPIKYIIRFRSVSKPWRDLIDGPDFTREHMCHSIKLNQSKLFITSDYNRMFTVDLSRLQHRNTADDIIPIHSQARPLNSAYVRIVDCCNGLFCLINWNNDTIFLYNPSTMTQQNITKLCKFKSSMCSRGPFINGFGYDAVNDDYKVVGMIGILNRHDYSFRHYVVDTYSSKSDSWRRIEEVIPYEMVNVNKSGISVGSALHWTAKSVENIIAFDIVTEEYREIPRPKCKTPPYPYSRVDVLGGNLCYLCSRGSASKFYVDNMWVMKEYGVGSSWTKLVSLSYSSWDQCWMNPIQPLVYSNCGKKVLLTRGAAILWYDLEKKVKWPKSNIKFQPQIRIDESYVCLESLVRLKDSINTSSTTTGKRKRKLKIEHIKISNT